jgi:hypothetical protein
MNRKITVYDTAGVIPGAITASWTSRDFLAPNWTDKTPRTFDTKMQAQFVADHPLEAVPCLDMEGTQRLGVTGNEVQVGWMSALKAARPFVADQTPIITYGMPAFVPLDQAGQFYGKIIDSSPANVAKQEQWLTAWRGPIEAAACASIDGYLFDPDQIQLEPNLKWLAIQLDRTKRFVPNLPAIVWCFGFFTNKEPVIPQDVADRMLLTALAHGADGFVYWDAAKRPCPMVDRLKEVA